jgi:ABC-type phosphate transport system substrate-binding protein
MAYKKSIGLGSNQVGVLRNTQQPKNFKPLQGLWTALLSTVTCATVLGMPSMLMDLGDRLGVEAAIAQTATPPVLPTSLPQGSKLAIDGSGSLAAMNAALKEKYEAKYKGTPVTVGTSGTAAGLQALEDKKVDLASIGRALTKEEIAKGFVAIPIKREKIAMLVSESNPFRGSLTIQQFAKIFRGEITNWSEVGGPDKPIRLIDQPEVSDTRNAFPNYPVFKSAPFQAVTGAVASGSENPEDVAAKLGDDGLGYVTADGIKNLSGVRALDMHKTQPTDPRYPFSQPIAYVYKKGSLTPAAAAFLGYIGTEEAKAAIKGVSSLGAVIEDSAALVATAIASPSPVGAASPVAAVPNNVPASAAPASTAPIAAVANNSIDGAAGFPWWPWLPLGLAAAGLAWWLLKGRSGAADAGAAMETGSTGSVAAVPAIATDEPDTEIQFPQTQTPGIPPIAGMVAGAAAVAGAAVAVATAGIPIVEVDPRKHSSSAITSDLDDETLAIDHDVTIHGLGSAEINPREVQGETGGLRFPSIDPLAGTIAVAGVGGAIAAGIAAAGNPGEPTVPAVTLPHEPITQLPPNVQQPIGLGDQSNNSPNDMTNNPAPKGNETSNNPVNLGMAAGVAAGIAAGVAIGRSALKREDLVDVDDNLPDLPSGYDESRIVLMARDPQWGYTYWDVPDDCRQALRNQGGQQLALRLYDVTDLGNTQNPHSLQQYSCDEMARDWYLPIPVSDREYITEIGYLTATGAWLLLARSNTVRIPPVYPSDWIDDQFITVDFENSIQGRTFLQLVPPGTIAPTIGGGDPSFNNPVFGVSQADQAARMAGSLFGSMHQIPAEALSSFVFPSGAGLWASEEFLGGEFWSLSTPSGMGMSGVGYSMSGVGYTMSGIGMGASMPPNRSRKFWLVADAELIIYGATEPDAQLTIGGVPVQLSPEGTFRMQMSFQDGNLDFPIMAIAKDGEQMRQIRMTFDRSTPLRKTNTKDEAQDEEY